MKLHQIIESFDTQTQTVNTNKYIRNSYRPFTQGSGGAYSHVTPDHDPHIINKVSHREDPAYNAFADFLIKNKVAQSNPHFPRIYVNKAYKSQAEDKQLWKMEKLPYTFYEYITLENDKEESINRIANLADMYLIDRKAVNYQPMSTDEKYIKRMASELFADLFESEFIKLDSWKEALEIMNNFGEDTQFNNDIHQNNVMVRTTSYGPQLVIIDPVS